MIQPVSGRFVSRLTRETLAIVLAGGRGSRLRQLTNWRAKPAVHYGGKFRIIDFPLSNCVNSGIRRISVLTQYKSHSLDRHVQRGWGFLGGELGEFVELLPAQQRLETSWYSGTADAVLQNLDIIRRHNPAFVLILAGDHVYKMDYGTMLAAHVESEADITVGCIEVPREQATAFGVMQINEQYEILRFAEKPADPEPVPGKPDKALASMGIYVFSREYLAERLRRDHEDASSAHDFGRNVLPAAIHEDRVCAYPFEDVETRAQAYWRDVGTVDAFYESNLELVGTEPELNLYDENWPIWTYQEHAPPAKFVFDEPRRRGTAIDSLVAGGCILSGATVRESLLSVFVRVADGSSLLRTVVQPHVQIGKKCAIRNAVIDNDCVVPDGTVIGYDPEADRKRFHVSEGGVVLVTPSMLEHEAGLREPLSETARRALQQAGVVL
jgi:glucose-1-phosphate adenylyltransferase